MVFTIQSTFLDDTKIPELSLSKRNKKQALKKLRDCPNFVCDIVRVLCIIVNGGRGTANDQMWASLAILHLNCLTVQCSIEMSRPAEGIFGSGPGS